MPITISTDGDSIAVPVGNVINQFDLVSKLVGITSDGRTNMSTWKSILESTFDNTVVFDLENSMFVMDCLAYLLANSHKAGVICVKYDDFRVDTEVTSSNMKCFISWKKSQKGKKTLERAQKHAVLTCKKLIKPVKTSYAYLIHSFWYLIENKGAIKYLYGYMNNISDRTKEQKPYLIDLSVKSTVLMTMRKIVGSIVKTRPLVGSGSYMRQLLILWGSIYISLVMRYMRF